MVGGLFSALEPLAFLGMALYTVAMSRRGGRNHPNRPALLWTVGCGIMSFVGAGFLGFAHTLPQTNIWTHGTLVTAMHGHLAFWGAYAYGRLGGDLLRVAADDRARLYEGWIRSGRSG
jgi:nitric oxide reductase subunit B